jgi:hypothetical protein
MVDSINDLVLFMIVPVTFHMSRTLAATGVTALI